MTVALTRLLESERAAFVVKRPRSRQLAERSRRHWLSGVPMHWMADWGTPYPLFVARAEGVTLTDVDGEPYTDFCLGDTGSMFGHSPPAVASAIALQASHGLTCMLPGERVAAVGEQLAQRFGLPVWQVMQTATDANRAALRWARALTGRRKILVFQGCYHGTVDETMVRCREGRAVMRQGAIGPALDYSQAAVVAEFNDVPALERALQSDDIAAVIAEPVMTNIGMVLPAPDYLETLQSLCRRHGTLLIIDETHTLSSGPGGYAGAHGLSGDFWVCGKAIAGGLPCAVLGFTTDVEARMQRVLASRTGGHSGMGTTLAANPLVFAALAAALAHLHTEATHAAMQEAASHLEQGLLKIFADRGLNWHVSRVGARIEFGFGPAPGNGSEAEAAMRPELEHALHLWLLNRGLLVTPFHNMMLTAPMLQQSHIDAVCAGIAGFLDIVDRVSLCATPQS
ncbi:MAG: aminotransferase class III-fold pyridoxal phosphate-dependent enzyme [Gammaproteobacteria bacterium]|nr:aminotransferase class III-fold pyridoxal phosphate-dependent enzyme [Gammaproteobacteria bacterium]